MNFEFRRFSADTNDDNSLRLHHDVCKFFDYYIIIENRFDFNKVYQWYIRNDIDVNVSFEDGCYRIFYSKDSELKLYNKNSNK